jgi:hypothetical protein
VRSSRGGERADAHPGLGQHLICHDRQTGRLVGITFGDREEDRIEAVASGREAQAAGGFDTDVILADGDGYRSMPWIIPATSRCAARSDVRKGDRPRLASGTASNLRARLDGSLRGRTVPLSQAYSP